ncbi:MAG: PD40 domain-containing protein [Anaerolineales bacterium]|nr:PD40 domain-containing protein [Anaerolineales bacterium]
MSTPNKILTAFDKTLLVGTGVGVIGICIVACVFYYILMNPPNQSIDPTPFVSLPLETSTASVFDSSTPTLLPTLDLGVLPSTLIPSPVPNFGGDGSLAGKIAFTCYIKQIDQICLMNADGSDRKQITEMEATAFYASISPDGQKIYFSSRRSTGFEIHSVNLNGNGLQRLTKNIGSLYAPELSPNGDWVVFTNNGNGLWLMKPDGKNPHALTTSDDIDPTWSADGSMIAFASSRAGLRQLFVMNADGSNIRQVTNLPDMGGRSSWSPDGTRLAFYAGPSPDRDVYIINVDGTGLVQLTDGGDNLGPSWSPDGNWIAFASFRDGNNEIYAIHPDGTGLTRLTNSPISDWQPRWGK